MAVEAVVLAVVDELAAVLIEESKFLHGAKEQIDWIRAELRGMQGFLREVEEKQGVDANVKDWIADLRDVAYDAEDIVDTLILRKERKKNKKIIKRYASIFSDLIARHKVGNEIERIRTKLREISERRSTYDIKNLGVIEAASSNIAIKRLRDTRRSFAHSNASDIIALEDDLMTLKSRLVEDDLNWRVVSIVGMGGLGKTTLARKVYNNKDVTNHFECQVWITVSQAYSAKGLLDDIWKKVMDTSRNNLAINEQNSLAIEQMAQKLSLYLKEKRYLVVMDDVWDVDAWNSVEAAFPITKNGSRVLLTTRKREVALQVQANKKSPLHEPKLLSDENSWVLFLKKVGIEESECPQNLVEIGKQIVKKCGGLPMAIVVLGGILSSKEASYSAWSRVLESISWQLKKDQSNCWDILALSYIDLPHYLKPCFIYFGIFPEDCEISIRRLIGLWLAEGLVQHRDNEPLEDVAEDCVEELISRSMIQVAKRRSDGKIKTCCMHDLLRDLALSKARETNFLHIYGNEESTLIEKKEKMNIRRLVAQNNVDKCPSSINCLRSYLVFSSSFEGVDGKLVSKFLDNGIQKKSFGLLRVLDLENVRVPMLPEALGQLIHLRYLGLRRAYSGSLPSSLGNLRNLQTLDVKYSETSVSDLPIWKLQQLQHLYMIGNENSKIVHPQVSSSSSSSFSLINLRTLWGVYIDGETQVKGGLDNSVHLKKLKVCGNLSSQGESLSNWFVKLARIEVLMLQASAGEECPYRLPKMMQFSNNRQLYKLHIEGRFVAKFLQVHEFPPNLTMLTLVSCELEEDPFPALEKLQNLRTLELSLSSYNGKEMVCSSGGFQQLQVLTLWWLVKLETWTVEDAAMPSLKTLKLVGCNGLKMIPNGLQHITTLQELVVAHVPRRLTTRIQPNDGMDWYKIEHIPSIRIRH